MLTTPDRWPLVGRGALVDRCDELLRGGRSVIVAGDAGVGKTRLLRELADRFDDDEVTRIAASSLVGLPLQAFAPIAGGPIDGRVPLVAVDDIQLLDEDAAALLHRLVGQHDVVLLASLRTGEPAPAAITAMWKDDHAVRFELGELERTDVDELLDAVLAGPIDAATRRRMWDMTLGSPLMLHELLRSALDGGTLVERDGLWRLDGAPRSVRLDELIGQRIDQLDDSAGHVVELVALGEPIGFSMLLAEVGHDALADAEAAGLVEIVVDELRRDVRMAHPLYGDVAERRMGEVRAAQRCRELLVLLELTPMRRRDDIVRATTWQLRSGGTTVSDDMVLAARRALYDERQRVAVELATRALAGDERGAEVSLVLGQALVSLGEHARAERFLREAERSSDADRALVAMQRAIALFWGLGDGDRAEEVLRVARVAVAADGPWHDELVAEGAVMAANRGRFAEASALAEPLLATSTGRTFVTASIAAASSWSLDGRCEDAIPAAERAYRESIALGPQPAMTDPGIFVVAQALAMSEAGRLAESVELSRVAHEVSVAGGKRAGQAWFSLVLGRTLLVRGRLGEAVDLFVEAAGGFAGIHSDGPRRWALAGAVIGSALRGDAAGARRFAAELDEVAEHPARMMQVEVERAAAFARLAAGDRAGAFDRFRGAVDLAVSTGAVTLGGVVLHDIVRLGGRVEPDEWSILDGCQGELGPLRRRFGPAVAREDVDELEVSAEHFARLGADLHAAEAAELAARLHDAAGRGDDARRCRLRSAAYRAATGESSPITLVASGPSGVTGRELEVARLAAAGRTNREIADELVVSVRTVENHLQRVYDKLGVRSRRDLPAALADT